MAANGGAFNYTIQNPYIDPAFGFNATVPISSGSLSVYFVWSRPNQVQDGANPTTASVTLLTIGGVAVLGMTGRGDGTDTITLFPSGAAISAGVVTLRHTHAARVCISSAGIDVWLDGTKSISAAANTLSLGATAALGFLTGAQCYFHEAGTWAKALSTSDHAALTLCMARWPVGARFAANGILVGQSNAGNLISGNILTTRTPFQYWSGALAANLLSSNSGGGSLYSGRGIYGAAGDSSFLLTNAGDGNPAVWAYGACGASFVAFIGAMSADLLAGVSYLAWFWSESDSMRAYSEKAVFTAALLRTWQLMRATLGKTAAQLPILVTSALPFSGSDGGCQMMREVMADCVANSALNVSYLLTQTADAIGQGDTWNAATGAESGGGNGAHRDDTGNANFVRRMALPIAQAVVRRNATLARTTEIVALPAGLTGSPGPQITAAHYEGTTYASTGSVLVTLQHNNGATDLIVPLQGAIGAGWTIMDGGTPAAPGTLVSATACVRVSATTIRLTTAKVLANASSAHLYYPYGQALTPTTTYVVIGQGDAVTDNFSTIALPAGWTAATDIGPSCQPNYPVQAPAYGIAFT
jgi:hypothetical protein